MQHGHPTPLVGRDAEESALALGLRMAKGLSNDEGALIAVRSGAS